jgi:four helix bundle protein
MSEENSKRFDLEERTFQFARRTRAFVKTVARTIGNVEDARQVIRSSGSVGANYIEANEALSKKDFVLHQNLPKRGEREQLLAASD